MPDEHRVMDHRYDEQYHWDVKPAPYPYPEARRTYAGEYFLN